MDKNIKAKNFNNDEYAFMWWPYGIRGVIPEEKGVLFLRTRHYGASFDVNKASLKNFGRIKGSKRIKDAHKEENELVENLPETDSEFNFIIDGKTFTSDQRPEDEKKLFAQNTRIAESGRFFQRFDIPDVPFKDDKNNKPPVKTRMEVTALGEYITILADITLQKGICEFDAGIKLKLDPGLKCFSEVPTSQKKTKLFSLTDDKSSGVLLSIPEKDFENIAVRFQNNTVYIDEAGLKSKEKKNVEISVTLVPFERIQDIYHLPFINPLDEEKIHATSPDSKEEGGKLKVEFDYARGWYLVYLPDIKERFNIKESRDIIEKARISILNDGDDDKTVPIMFFKEGMPGITGFSPMIYDIDGEPTGLPVQISKNWHDGTWFHGLTMVETFAGKELEFDFLMVYSHWGGIPAVSHAQLSLIGYRGNNQLWDQVALGSNGEHFCYDPDINLGRSMIDDVRPLMVTSYQTGGKWDWTCNVGGGDFLVYFNEEGQRVYLGRMRTFYRKYCPNLTEVIYSGITQDGKIEAEISVSTPRTDDIAKAFHKCRYEVLEPVEFSRIALYQIGADGYNDHTFGKMAYGNKEGVVEEWVPERGGDRYARCGIPLEGNTPWISLHEGVPKQDDWAWADRGGVIRSWKAVIGGKECPVPYFSTYGMKDRIADGPDTANVELSLPPETKKLNPGDFIEFEIEFIVMPQSDKDYYGSNKNLIQCLKSHKNTWRPVYRQAVGNDIEISVSEGELTEKYPPVVKTNNNCAQFEIIGGIAYMPVTFTGIDTYKGVILEEYIEGGWKMNQEVCDFRQAYYDPDNGLREITYSIMFDTPDEQPKKRIFRFRKNCE